MRHKKLRVTGLVGNGLKGPRSDSNAVCFCWEVGGDFGGLGGIFRMPMKTAQLSFRDRTQEFQGIAERLKKSFPSVSGPNGPSSSSKSEEWLAAVAVQSEFNRRASKIGFGIHQTSQKLAKLAHCECSSCTAAASNSEISY